MGVPVLAPIIQKSAAAGESSSVFFISSSPTSRHVLRTRNLRVKQHQENFVRDCKWHFHHHQIRSMGNYNFGISRDVSRKKQFDINSQSKSTHMAQMFLVFCFFWGANQKILIAKRVFSIALPQPSHINMKTAKLRYLILLSRVTYRVPLEML